MALLIFIVGWVFVGVLAWQLHKKGEAPPAPLIIQEREIDFVEARAIGVMVDDQLAGTLVQLPDDQHWAVLHQLGLYSDGSKFKTRDAALDYLVRQYLKDRSAIEYATKYLSKHREALLQKIGPLPVAPSEPGRVPNVP